MKKRLIDTNWWNPTEPALTRFVGDAIAPTAYEDRLDQIIIRDNIDLINTLALLMKYEMAHNIFKGPWLGVHKPLELIEDCSYHLSKLMSAIHLYENEPSVKNSQAVMEYTADVANLVMMAAANTLDENHYNNAWSTPVPAEANYDLGLNPWFKKLLKSIAKLNFRIVNKVITLRIKFGRKVGL